MFGKMVDAAPELAAAEEPGQRSRNTGTEVSPPRPWPPAVAVTSFESSCAAKQPGRRSRNAGTVVNPSTRRAYGHQPSRLQVLNHLARPGLPGHYVCGNADAGHSPQAKKHQNRGAPRRHGPTGRSPFAKLGPTWSRASASWRRGWRRPRARRSRCRGRTWARCWSRGRR